MPIRLDLEVKTYSHNKDQLLKNVDPEKHDENTFLAANSMK